MTERKQSLSALEHFSPEFSLKLSGQGLGIVEGYASTFGGEPDAYGDVVAPGAFSQTLAEHTARKSSPAMLWAHDPASPIGRWTSVAEDQKGLRVTGQLTMAVPRAQEAFALAKDGALAYSIGYRTRDYARAPNGGRLLKALDLGEISLVAMAANPSARITSIKSAALEIKDPRAFEQFLRDAGFPRAFAKAVTATGFKGAAGLCDADDAGNSELARMIRDSATQIEQFTKG
jgi:HK97 family phage prohead protease